MEQVYLPFLVIPSLFVDIFSQHDGPWSSELVTLVPMTENITEIHFELI